MGRIQNIFFATGIFFVSIALVGCAAIRPSQLSLSLNMDALAYVGQSLPISYEIVNTLKKNPDGDFVVNIMYKKSGDIGYVVLHEFSVSFVPNQAVRGNYIFDTAKVSTGKYEVKMIVFERKSGSNVAITDTSKFVSISTVPEGVSLELDLSSEVARDGRPLKIRAKVANGGQEDLTDFILEIAYSKFGMENERYPIKEFPVNLKKGDTFETTYNYVSLGIPIGEKSHEMILLFHHKNVADPRSFMNIRKPFRFE
ncbi:MAG: hypothetical protein HY453_00540 [Parcubacteria group bacterium]|nr:hypothetical protein [Parcubacteria group bacterium]